MPWNTEELRRGALQCDYPFDWRVRVLPAVAKAMACIAREGPEGIKEKREPTIQYWERRRSELEVGEGPETTIAIRRSERDWREKRLTIQTDRTGQVSYGRQDHGLA